MEARLRSHGLPPSPTDWNALGPDVDQVLVEIAEDSRAEMPVRLRAVSALGYFSTAMARRFLEKTIDKASSAESSDRLLVRKAAVALGWMGGATVPARLAPLLDSSDPEMRSDAALALGLTRLKGAGELLRKRAAVEPVPRVKTQIERQLRVLEAATAPAVPAASTPQTVEPPASGARRP